MKNKLLIISAILIAVVFLGCKGNSGSLPGEKNFSDEASYALGMNIGADLRNNMVNSSVYPDLDEFMKGMIDGLSDKNQRYSMEETVAIIDEAFAAAAEKTKADAMKKESDFLAENAKKTGINVTPSGLQYEIILSEDGPKPSGDDTVTVNYEGKLTDNTVFDSSEEGYPATFGLNQVIPGWTEGLQLMSVGSKYRFYIPSEIGYGENGSRNPYTGQVIIPAYATLIFEVELLEIKQASGD